MTDQGPQQQPGDMGGATPTPPPPQPAPQAPAPGIGSPADLGTRFLARLIDHVILGIVTAIIIVPLLVGAMFTGGSAGFGGFGFAFSGYSLVASIVTAAITILYFALMESNTGQTVGKMVLGLKTEGPTGDKPTMEQALKRNSWYALAIVPFLGGLAELAAAIYIAVTINNSVTRTGWHDTFAGGTKVVKAK